MCPYLPLSRLPRYALLVVLLVPSAAMATSKLVVGHFSSLPLGQTTPPGWEVLSFKKVPRHSRYTLIRDGDTTVIKAVSQAAASGLLRRISIDPGEYPLVQWRWRIEKLIKKSDIHSRRGDDYPARLYITFQYEADKLGFIKRMQYRAARLLLGDIPAAAINYVWANKAPVGTITVNAYTGFTQMIVVNSGKAQLGKWVTLRRNIYQDYLQAFGTPPPLINGVAIMTDSDDTGERATAYYGDITFSKAPH